MNIYDVGDKVRLTATFTNAAGTATDPTTVTCIVQLRPGLYRSTYTYAGATITKSGTGVYYVDVTVDREGIWDYRWVGTGTVVAADEGSFNIPDSQFF